MSTLKIALATLFLAAGVLVAQPDASPEPGPAADAMVTLPLPEFEALVSAAQAGGKKGAAPVAWAVRESVYACDATRPVVRVAAKLSVDVFAEGSHAVTIGGGVAFEKATLDGAEVFLVPGDMNDRAAVLVSGRGPHEIALVFDVPPGPEPMGMRRVTFAVARAAITRVRLSTDKPPRAVQPVGGVVHSAGDAKTETELLWPATDQITVQWSEPLPPVPVLASAAPAPGAPRLEGHLATRYQFRPDHLVLDALATFTVRQGAVRELKVAIPPGARLLRVRDAATDSTPPFTAERSTTGTLVVLKQAEPLLGDKRYRLEVEQAYTAPVPPAPAAPVAATAPSAEAGPPPPHGPAPAAPAPLGPSDVASPDAAPPSPSAPPANAASPAASTAAAAPSPSPAASVSAGPSPDASAQPAAPASPAVSPAVSPAHASASPVPAAPADPAPAPGASVAAAPVATGTTAPAATSGPPLTVALPFLSLPDAEANSGDVTLVHPALPLALDPVEPRGSFTQGIVNPTSLSSDRALQYSGTPSLNVTLRNVVMMASPACEVRQLRARTVLLPDGGTLTAATWHLMNRREASLTLSLPQGADVLTAYLDHDPVRLGVRSDPGFTVRMPGAADARGPLSAPATTSSTASVEPAARTTGDTAHPAGTEVPPAMEAWQDVVVPLRQDTERPLSLEIVYRERGAPLGYTDRRTLRLPKTAVDITSIRWDVDVPAGYTAWVASTDLKVGERTDRPADPTALSTAAAPLRSMVDPRGPPMGVPAAPRFELPDLGPTARFPLAGDTARPNARLACEVGTVSTGAQSTAGALVFVLTLVLVSDLFWFGAGTAVLALAGTLLLGTLVTCTVLGIGVMSHLLAGLLAGLTFKLIRMVMEPSEEKETT